MHNCAICSFKVIKKTCSWCGRKPNNLETELCDLLKKATTISFDFYKDPLNKNNPSVEMFDDFLHFYNKWKSVITKDV